MVDAKERLRARTTCARCGVAAPRDAAFDEWVRFVDREVGREVLVCAAHVTPRDGGTTVGELYGWPA
jgi:uncharacterized heparinase superfamily protein